MVEGHGNDELLIHVGLQVRRVFGEDVANSVIVALVESIYLVGGDVLCQIDLK